MSEERITIDRRELFDPAIDKALAREKLGRQRIIQDKVPVSAFRRFINNSLVYLPIAAVVAALSTWWLLDSKINEFPMVGGEVTLVNNDPFESGGIRITIGQYEVSVDPEHVKLEPGLDGEPAFQSASEIKPGDKIEAAGISAGGTRVHAAVLRPTQNGAVHGGTKHEDWALMVLFPLTAAFIAFALLFAEGWTTRNWVRMIERSLLGTLLAAVFAFLAMIGAGIVLLVSKGVMDGELHRHAVGEVITVREISGTTFFIMTACRSAAWAMIGAAIGVGMNLVRSTKTQLRNSVIGGAIGGAFGGLFFDPIDRFFGSLWQGGGTSRLVGLLAVGLAIGIFVALVERLGREAWLRVRTGPLAGKSFILYKTPTIIGSAPQSDIYLYKDAEIDAKHVSIHRVGTTFEIEDMGSRMGTTVGGSKIRRRRLVSGDQIVVGSTILDFEERQKRTPGA